MTAPPRLAIWLLSRTVPAGCRDAVLGDLEEEFVEQALPRLGARRARLWFWRQAFSLARAYALARHDTVAAGLHPPRTDTMRHDLRDAVRSLLRSPAYTLTAIAVLALGIGATSSIFSFVDGVLLRPLPYPNPERIVLVFEKPPGGLRNGVATANFLDWRSQNDVFEAIAATSTVDDDAGRDRRRPRGSAPDACRPATSTSSASARLSAARSLPTTSSRTRPRRRAVESHVADRVRRPTAASSGATSCSMARRSR